MYKVAGVSVTAFDVSLRDGLQALTPDQQREFTLQQKLDLYDHIISTHDAEKIEIGSFVNPNVLPIFDDTGELLDTVRSRSFSSASALPLSSPATAASNADSSLQQLMKRQWYVLVPNQNYLKSALQYNPTHFSFLASVSNSFQKKNTKMNIEENYRQLVSMFSLLQSHYHTENESNVSEQAYRVRIYVSCINECPLEGKISHDIVIQHILELMKFQPETLCLSDTCGTMTLENFQDILTRSIAAGIDTSKFSLHLHVQEGREEEIIRIIHCALDHQITEFDVSALTTGGCSVTMDKDKLAPNLSYDLFNKALQSYYSAARNPKVSAS